MGSPCAVRPVPRGSPGGVCVPGCRATRGGLACLVACLGCGGASPLMHPAHPLDSGRVTAGAGVSGHFASKATGQLIDEGQAAAQANSNSEEARRRYAEGVLTEALVAPGATPFVALRVGLPEQMEAGMSYTGRGLRVDGRKVFLRGPWAASLGIGASLVLEAPESRSPLDAEGAAPDSELEAGGFSVDLPVLLGFRGVAEFLDAWVGPRVGYERLTGDLSPGLDGARLWRAQADRFWMSVVGGISVGVPPVWLRVELDATAHWISGSLTDPAADPGPNLGGLERSGWTLSPSVGLIGKL